MSKEACWVVGFGPTVVESPVSAAKPRASRNFCGPRAAQVFSRCAFHSRGHHPRRCFHKAARMIHATLGIPCAPARARGHGCRGAPPLARLHTACLLLLGALAAAPAEAQHPCTPSYAEDVWCATMTVAEFTRSTAQGPQPTFGYSDGIGGSFPTDAVGGLSNTAFTYDGASYTVRYLALLATNDPIDLNWEVYLGVRPTTFPPYEDYTPLALHIGSWQDWFDDSGVNDASSIVWSVPLVPWSAGPSSS